MRRFLISVLLASAAASPALAAPDDFSDRRAARQSAREDRQSAREDRQSTRKEKAARDEKATRQESAPDRASARKQGAPAVAPIAVAPQLAPRAGSGAAAARQRAAERQSQATARGAARERAAERQSVANQTRTSSQAARDLRAGQRDQRVEQSREYFKQVREARRNAPPPAVSPTPRPNTQPPAPAVSRPSPAPQWNTGWRNNSRYNWGDYRRRHRSLFNLGFYFDPFGWGYQPYRIGWRMWPSYFGSSYWLHDPWRYRLPYAPPGTRWIRYYDDAILVDMWSGQVVDVIYDFFW